MMETERKLPVCPNTDDRVILSRDTMLAAFSLVPAALSISLDRHCLRDSSSEIAVRI